MNEHIQRPFRGILNSLLIQDDEDLHIDPQEHIIERYGHGRYYTTHECPKCETVSECKVSLCRLSSTVECLPCLQRELLEDTERFAKEARTFLATALPTDDETLRWWRAVQAEIDGKLKGLATRSAEVQKRMDLEI